MKLAGLVGSGADVKRLLAGSAVQVNGEVETRRGRTLHIGDEVGLDGLTVRVLSSTTEPDQAEAT